MTITIDGPAGSGKSTVADILAEKLNFIHFNSGALFRGLTAHLLSTDFDVLNITPTSKLPKMNLTVEMINNVQHVIVNNVDYTSVLRDNEVSTNVAFVALNENTRKIVDKCQKEFCANNNVVIEGRDIGSHVFPNAELKFYLDCNAKERAKRRFLEEKAKNPNITIDEIEAQIIERDKLDKEREIAPLVIPKNAIIVDSTGKTIAEVVDILLESYNYFNKTI